MKLRLSCAIVVSFVFGMAVNQTDCTVAKDVLRLAAAKKSIY